MSRSLAAAFVWLVAVPVVAFAQTPVVDTLAVDGSPWQDSWREAARAFSSVGARAHASADAAYGPALFRRGRSASVLRVTLDGLPLMDPFSGHATFELPLESLAGLAQASDGSLALRSRGAADDAMHAMASVHSEALSDALGSLQSGARERYDLTLLGARRTGAGRVEFVATGQAREFGDREPRFVDRPYPGDASVGLGGAPYSDGRLPGNGLSGKSGHARLAWASPDEHWRVALAGAASHDDRREYVHAHLMNAAHMPRVSSRWTGGALALAYTGPAELSLRVARTASSNDRGDRVWFGDVEGWAQATRNDPVYDVDAPFFWSPGHVYGLYERSHAECLEVAGAAKWRPSPRRTLSLEAMGQEWTARAFSVAPYQLVFDGSGALAYADYTGYGYDGHGRKDDRSERWSRRQELSLRDDWQPTDHLRAGYALGFTRVDQPRLTVILDGNSVLHYIQTGMRGELYMTPAFEIGQQFPAGRAWSASVRRVVPELSGRAQMENIEALPVPAWEANLAVASELARGWRGRAEVWAHEAEEPATPTGRLYMSGPPAAAGSEYARGMEMVLERTVPARLHTRLSGAWSRERMRMLARNRRDIAWASGSSSPEVVTDDDRALSFSGQAALWLGGSKTHRPWRLDAIVRAESGAPYTSYERYNEVTLSAVSGMPSGNLNSARMPWGWTTDLAATRTFRLAGVGCEATAQLYNAFDRHNVAEVFAGTGQADWTGWLETVDGQAYLQQAGEHGRQMYELAQHDPTHWQRPRTFTLVLRAAF